MSLVSLIRHGLRVVVGTVVIFVAVLAYGLFRMIADPVLWALSSAYEFAREMHSVGSDLLGPVDEPKPDDVDPDF